MTRVGNHQLTVNSLREAVTGIVRESLASRLSSHRAISVHRLVQFTVFSKLTMEEISKFFDYAARMLFFSFPNTWNEKTQQSHGSASWETCSAILPHVNWLMKLTGGQSPYGNHIGPHIPDKEIFAELVFRAGT